MIHLRLWDKRFLKLRSVTTPCDGSVGVRVYIGMSALYSIMPYDEPLFVFNRMFAGNSHQLPFSLCLRL